MTHGNTSYDPWPRPLAFASRELRGRLKGLKVLKGRKEKRRGKPLFFLEGIGHGFAARCRIDAGYRPRGSVRDFSVLLAQGETSLAKGKKAGIEGIAAL